MVEDNVNKDYKFMELPKYSQWSCYLFGSTPKNPGIIYRPSEGNIPNAFIQYMMKVCFACTWIKNNPTDQSSTSKS